MKILMAIILDILLSNCATLIRGSEESVSFQSTPTGTKVILANGRECKTPCQITIPREAGMNAVFTQCSSGEKTIYLDKSASGGAKVGGFLLGGIIGTAVDFGAGAVYNVSPNPAITNMEYRGETLL